MDLTAIARKPKESHRLGAGAPMHVHYLQEEAARVVSGRLGYLVPGGEAKFADSGETVVWPAWHAAQVVERRHDRAA